MIQLELVRQEILKASKARELDPFNWDYYLNACMVAVENIEDILGP